MTAAVVTGSFVMAALGSFYLLSGHHRIYAEGKVLGRLRMGTVVEAKVVALWKQGRGMRAIARELGIGNCTVQRIVTA